MSDIFGIGEIGSSAIDAGATIASATIQADAINNATDAQRDAFNTITANNKPFLNTGTSALGRLANIYGLDSPSGVAANGNAPANGGATGQNGDPVVTWGDGTQTGGWFAQLAAGNFPSNQQPQGAQATASPQAGAQPQLTASQGLDPNGTFYQSPDFLFRFGQGIRGVDAGASARHMLDSGATRKAEIQYAGNLASGEFNTYANRLMDLTRVGQSAASNQATASQGYANNIGNLAAAGANNWSNAINNAAGQFKSSYNGGGAPISATSPSVINSGYSIGNPGYQNTVQLPSGF